jgi:hypothetical protein
MGKNMPRPPVTSLIPGMAPGTHKRNVLVLLLYLLLSFVGLAAAGVAVPRLVPF